MNNNLQSSQSGNILSAFTTPIPIKRGRGRPRKNPLVSQVSTNISKGASTVPIQPGS